MDGVGVAATVFFAWYSARAALAAAAEMGQVGTAGYIAPRT